MNALKNRVLALSLPRMGALWFVALAGVLGCPAAALANVISMYPASVNASSSYVGYPSSDAIDSGPNSLVTDWATNGGGVTNYLDMTLPAVKTLLGFSLTDRTTSGGSNGVFHGGTGDFTTQFELQVYSDALFSIPVGSPIVFSKSVPSSPLSPAAFLFTASLPSISAQYVRYQILAVDGSSTNSTANPGLANIEFSVYAVPEPASFMLLGLGGIGLLFVTSLRRPGIQS